MLSLRPRQGKNILKQLEELPSRNVSVRVVTSVPSVRTNSTDLKLLKEKGLELLPVYSLSDLRCVNSSYLQPPFLLPVGVQVRKVNFGRLTHGVLHSKFWVVDSKHVFIGSANMDWRALTQVRTAKNLQKWLLVFQHNSLTADFFSR